MLRRLARPVTSFVARLPLIRDIYRTAGTAAPITIRSLVLQKVFGFNRQAYWPMHHSSLVTCASRIRIGIGTAPGLSPGCYIQGGCGIEIGDYTVIAPNVGMISANHDPYDYSRHIQAPPIKIGAYCWIGMNAVILPGVELGDYTVVGAGAVVNKSFPDGYCVLAGVPARSVRQLDCQRVKRYRYPYEYVGFYHLGERSKNDLYRRLGVADVLCAEMPSKLDQRPQPTSCGFADKSAEKPDAPKSPRRDLSDFSE
jgi:acetyltransferase-like isoleucine patch superfamily enzyme